MRTKAIIMSGANGNLGKIVAERFAAAGYTVLAPVVDERALQGLPQHQQVIGEVVNLADELAVGLYVEKLIRDYPFMQGGLMLAGGFAVGSIMDTDGAAIDRQVELNFKTAYFLARPLYKHLSSVGKGSLVFVGARPALEAGSGKGLLAYSISKTMVIQLAELINAQARGTGVTASVVVPGIIDTPANRQAMPDGDFSAWVTPDALAEIFLFLFSEQAGPLRQTLLKAYNGS